MEKINIGIITNLRKLLFAYRVLFSEHIQSLGARAFGRPAD